MLKLFPVPLRSWFGFRKLALVLALLAATQPTWAAPVSIAGLQRRTESRTVRVPQNNDRFLLFKAVGGDKKLLSVDCIVDHFDADGAGDSIPLTINICDALGNNCVTADTGFPLTCGNVGAQDDGALSNPDVPLGSRVEAQFGAVTGAIAFMTFTVEYR